MTTDLPTETEPATARAYVSCHASAVLTIPTRPTPSHDRQFQTLWTKPKPMIKIMTVLKQAVADNLRTFPRDLGLKVTIADCRIDEQGQLLAPGSTLGPRLRTTPHKDYTILP